jgi:hypothetical protein
VVNGREKRRESGGKEFGEWLCGIYSIGYREQIVQNYTQTPKVWDIRLLVPRGPKIPK